MRERVTTDQIKLARTVDLISYMQRYEPEELIRTGPHDYKTATHSSLCISDNGLYKKWPDGFANGENSFDSRRKSWQKCPI